MNDYRDNMAQYAQAQRLMQSAGSPHFDWDGSIVSWSWDADAVRQRFGEPDDYVWLARVLELERRGYAGFTFYAPPVYTTEDGQEAVFPWEDEPLEDWASLWISSAGILALAALYP